MSEESKRGMSNLVARLLTAAVVVPVLLALLFITPKWAFLILVFLAAIVAAIELSSMTMPGQRLQQAWSVVATVGTVAALYWVPTSAALASCVIGVLVAGLLVGLVAPDPIETAGSRMAWLVVTPLYAGGLMHTLAMLHRLDHGGQWVSLAMLLAWFGDTGGYFAGRAFGKHKLYPTISPKKTIEGSIGGLGGSVGGALIMHAFFLPELGLLQGIGLGLVAGAIGQAGDLTMSLVKRSARVKDSGWIVPGHGGLLDRIDALMLTAAVTWLFTVWFLG